ncbi:hypothetical protein VNO80_33859 [Phaseolus coccineus]|uniref:Uncharacterized protein n=1 Tax=Phaseolus coccineus TaxID=3886 RepID=A0AAN9KY67_PHACN
MNGSEGGAGFYFRAGREVKAIRLPSRGVYSTHSPVFRTAQVSVRLRMRTSFPSAHSPFTRFSKQRRKGGQQNRSTQFPFFSGALALYLRHTRKDAVGSSPSLCPADHSAGILHSRLRLTAARGWSCRYVSLSGSLAPPVISFYDMLLSSPYSICNLVISASLRVSTHLRKKRRTSFSDSAIAL